MTTSITGDGGITFPDGGTSAPAAKALQTDATQATGWVMKPVGTDLVGYYNNVKMFKVSSTGDATFAGNVTAYGTI